jgi:predicted MFS family arabinose efflux permease
MSSIAAKPAALWLFATSLLARLPLAMLTIAVLVHVEHLTGSFAVAGAASGAYAAALGAAGPALGRLADRRGPAAVVIATAVASAALLFVFGMLPADVPAAALVALAGALGAVTPPVGACLRALLPGVIADPAGLRSAYAIEATASELTFIAGPPLALGIGAVLTTGSALVVAGAVLLVASIAFAVQRPAREWTPAPRGADAPAGSLRVPAMQTLIAVMTAVGIVFGAAEVAITAAADALNGSAAAGPLLALWGVGSLAGGLVAARRGGTDTAVGLALLLLALAAGHLALGGADGSLPALAAVVVLAGAAIAPTYAAVYAMVDRAAPAGAVTEAFAWLATAVSVGAAAGAAVGGMVVDSAGPTAAFALSGGAGAIAVAVTLVRAGTLRFAAPAMA